MLSVQFPICQGTNCPEMSNYFLYKNLFNITFLLYNIAKLQADLFGILDKDLCDWTDLTLYGAHYETVSWKFQFLNFSVSWNKYKVKMSKFSYLMVFSLFFDLLHLCNIALKRVLNGQFFKGAHILSLHIFTAKTA